jgi:hypothetical protein
MQAVPDGIHGSRRTWAGFARNGIVEIGFTGILLACIYARTSQAWELTPAVAAASSGSAAGSAACPALTECQSSSQYPGYSKQPGC